MESDREPAGGDVLHRIAALEQRVGELESSLRAVLAGDRTAASEALSRAEAAEPAAAETPGASSELLPLVGRTLLIFAGAFLLRALTEGGTLPPTLGSALGVLYAATWIFRADRSAAAGDRARATLYGLAGAGIALPLLWEATVRFGFMRPAATAVALAAVTAAGLVVAARHRLAGLAAIFALGAAATLLALAVSTRLWVVFIPELQVLSVALMLRDREHGWPLVEWILNALSFLALAVMAVTWQASPAERVAELYTAGQLLAILLIWVTAVTGALGWRSLRRGAPLTFAEISEGLGALVVGLGGALVVSSSPDVGTRDVGLVSLALAAGCYAAAFALADRRLGRRSFLYYGSVALTVTLLASAALLSGPWLTRTLLFAGLVTALLGWARGRATLTVHSAVYVTSAAWVSGAVHGAVATLLRPQLPPEPWIDLDVVLVLLVAAIASWLPVAMHGRTWGRFSRAPKVVLEVLLLAGLAAVTVTLVGHRLPAPDGLVPTAMLDALRSGVLAVCALLAAALGRSERWPEAGRLVYPILGLGAVKLLLVDTPHGTAASLMFSLLFYGGALILVPRLRRPSDEEPGPAPRAS